MEIIKLNTQPTDQWKQTIVERYPFPPYWWIREITPASHQALMQQELDRACATEKAHLWGCVSEQGDLLGFAQMHWLEWDTRHFGFETWQLEHLGAWGGSQVAQALVRQIVQIAHEHRYQNVQARLPVDNLIAVHALEGTGFQTMEVLTTWMFELDQTPIPAKANPELVRDFEPADTDALIELARTAYTPTADRFHVDPHLSQRASDELYAEWIRNSCSGQLADHIAVSQVEGKAVGYATLKYFGDHDGRCNARVARLGLGGMSPQVRNRGLVTDLVIHNLEWLRRRQANFCLVGTQGNNIPPQRVWLKIGFKPATTALTLCYWTDDHM